MLSYEVGLCCRSSHCDLQQIAKLEVAYIVRNVLVVLQISSVVVFVMT